MRSSFFFSSRRRHTRWTGDWSSDVCSSDLRALRPDDLPGALEPNIFKQYFFERARQVVGAERAGGRFIAITDPGSRLQRSEERRVGKEGKAGGVREWYKR